MKKIKVVSESPKETPIAVKVVSAGKHPKKEGPKSSYAVMFTIEGHATWRISLYPGKADFDDYLSKQINHPKITAKKFFVIDRITGNITEEK